MCVGPPSKKRKVYSCVYLTLSCCLFAGLLLICLTQFLFYSILLQHLTAEKSKVYLSPTSQPVQHMPVLKRKVYQPPTSPHSQCMSVKKDYQPSPSPNCRSNTYLQKRLPPPTSNNSQSNSHLQKDYGSPISPHSQSNALLKKIQKSPGFQTPLTAGPSPAYTKRLLASNLPSQPVQHKPAEKRKGYRPPTSQLVQHTPAE